MCNLDILLVETLTLATVLSLERMNNARRISRGVVFSIFVLTTRVAKDLGRFNVESKSMSPEHDEYEQLSLIRNTETECAFNLITSGKQSSPLG